jgi:hypothetical protein
MTWEPPTFTEIKMDAELTAYCDDLEQEPSEDTYAAEAPCASVS